MAVHSITLKIEKGIEVVNTDISFKIKKDGSLLGTLTLSKGSIDWRPTKKHMGGKHETQMSWSAFDKLMREAR
jgi:hypothetical protein